MNPSSLTPAPDHRRLRILLCGYGHLGLALLQGMQECPECEVAGVFRWSSRPESANFWEPAESQFQQAVLRYGIPDLQCAGVNSYEFAAILERLRPDVLLVGAWGEIIRKHLIERPGLILVNCHPSRLPAHRGANPYSSVIRMREIETGVTFHRIAPAIDAGAILLQEPVPLYEHDTGADVRDRCAVVAYHLVKTLVDRLHAHVLQGEPLPETEQNHGQGSYFPPLKMEDGLMDWSQPPETLYRQYRALYPWIVCHACLEGGRMVLFHDPHFVERPAELSSRHAPGMVLSLNNGLLAVALSDPDWMMTVSTYQVAHGNRYLPPWLSRLLSPLWLRPGRRFASPQPG